MISTMHAPEINEFPESPVRTVPTQTGNYRGFTARCDMSVQAVFRDGT